MSSIYHSLQVDETSVNLTFGAGESLLGCHDGQDSMMATYLLPIWAMTEHSQNLPAYECSPLLLRNAQIRPALHVAT